MRRELGRVEDAAADFARAAVADPADADSYVGLGLCLGQLERLDEARQSIEHALRLAPGHETARALLAALDGGAA